MTRELLNLNNDDLQVCPRCGRRALAHVHDSKYECLWCGFSRDLSEPRWTVIPAGMALVFLVIAIL